MDVITRAELDRSFRIVAFDWDGTAVVNRADDAAPVRRPLERLLRVGVPVVVITGTNAANIDRQLSSAIRGPHKRRLYLATNRGSEVYGFDTRSELELIHKRVATAREEELLTAVADALRARLCALTGLEIQVIYDRLNRRKVDLIPTPEWRDPPKAALGELANAVEARLRAAGLSSGLAGAFDLACSLARDMGLPHARITSDVKHIEIGLTDKADAVAWLMRELAAPLGVASSEVLIGGDEFGPIAGFPGSDAKMLDPAGDAVVVSVGPEPAGVPARVIHLGGGPARFRQIVSAQAARHPIRMPATPIGDPAWELIENGATLAREHEFESLFALGNGHIGSRASLAEGSVLSSPATFIAGFYERKAPGAVPELRRMPDWSRIGGRARGVRVHVDEGTSLDHVRVLDLRRALLFRNWRHRDADGRVTRILGLRLVSLANRRVLIQSIAFTPENYSGDLVISAALTGTSNWSEAEGARVSAAVESLLEQPAGFERLPASPDGPTTQWQLPVEIGKSYRLDRVFCVHTARNSAAPELTAGQELETLLRASSAEDLVRAHTARWREQWRACDVRIAGDRAAQRALRFAVYHLLAAADPGEERVSIGARALTGSAYKGHVFWDTDVYMLPFFTLTQPEAARALLMYRHHTLPAARRRARALGYAGALYAWESADSGDDVTPNVVLAPDGELVPILVGTQEQHISADVAYAVCEYVRWTGDDEFLLAAGAEIVLETARFWASRCEPGDDGLLHINRVIGPDEYHESVDDNAYTNGMARWNLERAAQIAALLRDRWPERFRELEQRLSLDPGEPEQWLRLAAQLYTGFDPTTGLFEQFRGYFELEEIPLARADRRTAPIDVTLGRERVRGSRIVKQPDVAMLIHMLWDRFPAEVRARNFRFYEPRTAHGSSLSPSIHALLAARLGDLALAQRYFRQAAEIDLADNMGNASGGVHAAALGGLWQAAVFGFAGLHLTQDGPALRPNLPSEWSGMEFQLKWRGQSMRVSLPSGAIERPAAAPSPEVLR